MSDQLNNDSTGYETITVARSAYVVISLIFGGPLILVVPAVTRHPSFSSFEVIALQSTFLLIGLFWLRSIKIELSGQGIGYTTLFSGRRFLAWSEIKTAELKFGYRESKLSNAVRPIFRLVIEPQPSSGKPPIIINIKVLSKNDVKHLMDIVDSNVKTKNPLRGSKALKRLGITP
jgi:hypothetical protein